MSTNSLMDQITSIDLRHITRQANAFLRGYVSFLIFYAKCRTGKTIYDNYRQEMKFTCLWLIQYL